MKPSTLRNNLIHTPHALSLMDLAKVDVGLLCDESLLAYYHLTLQDIPSKALEAALLLDLISLPRRGKVTDESGGYLSQRSARLSRARNF